MPSFHETRRLLTLLCAALTFALPAIANAVEEGEKVFQDTCTSCHDAKTRPLDQVRLTREQWKDAIERMEGQGAQIPSGKKLSALLDWLERTHGPQGAAPADKK
jgi:cytochrome c5